jgi:hypothetical protein
LSTSFLIKMINIRHPKLHINRPHCKRIRSKAAMVRTWQSRRNPARIIGRFCRSGTARQFHIQITFGAFRPRYKTRRRPKESLTARALPFRHCTRKVVQCLQTSIIKPSFGSASTQNKKSIRASL